MIRKLHDWRLLFPQIGRLVSFCTAILLLLIATPALRAQNPVYSYSEYWKVSGWHTPSYMPPTQLQISIATNLVSITWPYSISNTAMLQTTTNLSPGSEWVTLTNQPIVSAVGYPRTVTLPAQDGQHYFRLAGAATIQIPVFGFAIFYNDQLEFTQTAPLNIRGRVHANGRICLGAAPGNILRFSETVTTASSIVFSNLGGYTSFATPIYEGTPTTIIGTPLLRLQINTTTNTPDALREIINVPPLGEAATSRMGQQRYNNKAAVVILVSNTTVTLTVKDQGALTGTTTNFTFNSAFPSATEHTNLARVLPFLNLTNRFHDYRESKWVMPTQIDMGVLKNWLPTNAMVLSRYPAGGGFYPNILYVGDFRTVTNLHAIRIRNGLIIPTNGPSGQSTGFTIATPNPLYVWGHFNSPNLSHLGTTNTTAKFPASLVCDAVTVLSPNWTDSVYGNSSTALDSRNATSTTVNAAIIAGSVYSTGSAAGQWSGGVQNLTRLLENWSGYTLTLNGSWVNFYNSVRANTQFQNPGIYYRPPTRNFNFDPSFNSPTKLPPGTPLVSGIVPPN